MKNGEGMNFAIYKKILKIWWKKILISNLIFVSLILIIINVVAIFVYIFENNSEQPIVFILGMLIVNIVFVLWGLICFLLLILIVPLIIFSFYKTDNDEFNNYTPKGYKEAYKSWIGRLK